MLERFYLEIHHENSGVSNNFDFYCYRTLEYIVSKNISYDIFFISCFLSWQRWLCLAKNCVVTSCHILREWIYINNGFRYMRSSTSCLFFTVDDLTNQLALQKFTSLRLLRVIIKTSKEQNIKQNEHTRYVNLAK